MFKSPVHRLPLRLVTILTLAVAAMSVLNEEGARSADTTTAVWFGEIMKYGIVTSGTPDDTLRPMAPVYAYPGDSTVVDSLRVGRAVKYERLSELTRTPPIKLASDDRYRGEWFKVELADLGGWL